MQVWWQTDPKAEAAYGVTPYNSMFNNPIVHVDPEGDFAWIPFAIGAALGAYSGHSIAESKGVGGIGMLGYMLGGAAIGGFSSLTGYGTTQWLGNGLMSKVGGLWATGIGGSIGGGAAGAGFGWMSGQGVGDGLWKGAVSGLVGAGLSGYIGGGEGALLGGASAGAVSSGLNGENIGLGALVGGAVSYGSYQLTMHINYKNLQKTGSELSRKQFNAISKAAQRSFTRGKEFGGWLLEGGGVEKWSVIAEGTIKPTPKPDNAIGAYHTHPGQGPKWYRGHSPQDFETNNATYKVKSFVVGRKDYWLHNPGTYISNRVHSTNFFQPYPYNTYHWRLGEPGSTGG